MKYDYYVHHWEVEVVEKTYSNGHPLYIKPYWFYAEENAVQYAKERCKEGKQVSIKAVQWMEGWE